MKLHHTEPCKDCPWRKTSLKGYLGGWPIEQYSDAVAAGEVPACHNRDQGPDSDDTAFCVGALSCMANQAMLPPEHHSGQKGAKEARDTVGRNLSVFGHHAEFHKYHAGVDWVHPLMRPAFKEDTLP